MIQPDSEILLFYAEKEWATKPWKDTEDPWMHLYERSQSEQATYYRIPTLWPSGKDKTMEAAKRSADTEEGMDRWCTGEF